MAILFWCMFVAGRIQELSPQGQGLRSMHFLAQTQPFLDEAQETGAMAHRPKSDILDNCIVHSHAHIQCERTRKS